MTPFGTYGLIEGADPTIAALTARVDVRFADTTLIDLAPGGTPVDLVSRKMGS